MSVMVTEAINFFRSYGVKCDVDDKMVENGLTVLQQEKIQENPFARLTFTILMIGVDGKVQHMKRE